jgi:hypothetical protein
MKNMNDIRQMLCDEIQKIRDGKTTPANVNAITNATGKILSTIKLELEYAKLSNTKPKDSGFIQLEEKVSVSEAAAQ